MSRLAQLEHWLCHRASEYSTYAGLAMALTAIGKPSLAEHITDLGAVAPTILGAIGAGLAAASTSPRPSAQPALIEPTPAAPAPSETETDMKLVAPIAAAALLAGCATTGTTSTALLTTTKALTVAENAYQLAAAGAIDAASTGLVTPATAIQIKAANDKAVGLLDAAKTAQTTAEQAADANDALTAIGELSALIPAKAAS